MVEVLLGLICLCVLPFALYALFIVVISFVAIFGEASGSTEREVERLRKKWGN